MANSALKTSETTTPLGAALYLLDHEVTSEADISLAERMKETAINMLADDMVAEAGRRETSEDAGERIKAGYLRLAASLVRSDHR